MTGQESMGTNWNEIQEISFKHKKKIIFLCCEGDQTLEQIAQAYIQHVFANLVLRKVGLDFTIFTSSFQHQRFYGSSLLPLTQDKECFLVCEEVTAALITSESPCLCNKRKQKSDYFQAVLSSYAVYQQKPVFRCLLFPGQRVCYLRNKENKLY